MTAIMTKECERVLGQKAQGVDAPSALSKLKGKVCVWGRRKRIAKTRFHLVCMCTCETAHGSTQMSTSNLNSLPLISMVCL